ncbi:MAG: LytTR family transcriptional regulator DNA-binding domain-containing protein [Lewinellaceae bacterium]|nr:LytTR family transcriptional regulator DNA-binding domain-containing protein [Phaeodactylibacter sp.]MCB9041768.1 LytTR family transcriptional regulator DNA-binding domain-containing protein [Lewinellaceae bacterium]
MMKNAVSPQAENALIKKLIEKLASLDLNLYANQLIARVDKLYPLIAHSEKSFLKVSTKRGFVMFRSSDILRIETHSSYAKRKGGEARNGDGNLTHIFTKWGGHFQMARKVCEWKALLKPEDSFLQTHQSHIVNTQHIRRVYDEDGMVVELVNGEAIPVSRKFRGEVMSRLLENPPRLSDT